MEQGQEYCLECGGRLPSARGVLPALAGAWRARLRWYPGDWIWSALLLLGIAAAGGAVAMAATEADEPRTQLLVATADRPVPAPPRPTQRPTPPPEERTGSTATQTETSAESRPRKLVAWPPETSGHTVVLVSLPASAGRARATRIARRALRAGLPDVGFLDSSQYASLHPDYYVVFSGIYESADDAASALAQAQQLGFSRAYTRQIVS